MNESKQEGVSVLLAFLTLMLCGLLPGMFVLLFYYNIKSMRSINFKKRFGVLYDDYKDFKIEFTAFMFLYFWRRFILAFSIAVLKNYPGF